MRGVMAALAVAASVVVPVAGDGPFVFPRSAPEAQGIASEAIQSFVEEAERTIDALHSLVIVRHGVVVAEGWWAPYSAGEPHQMFSLSKSFTSTAVGMAVSEGLLSTDDPVLKFFPDEAPAEPSANLKAMRVRDLLTMTAGHHEEDLRGFPYNSEESVVRRFLSLPVAHKPGTLFVYNTPASYMLSAIVQKVTGQPVVDYLGSRLFQPLGITGATWDASRQGVSMGGFGLNVRTEDIARFGELYLRKGQWQGRQIVPAAWVEAATSRQVSNGSSPSSDWEQGYGYQFWRSRHGFYRGDGAHGQFCLVLPEYDTVVAITAGTRDMGAVMNLVWERLVPALGPQALPENRSAKAALASKLAALTLPAITGETRTAAASAISGRRYEITGKQAGLEAVTLTGDGEDTTVTFRLAGKDHPVSAQAGRWRRGTSAMTGSDQVVAASGAWTAADTYTLKVVRYRTPFATTYRLRFRADTLEGEVEQNVGPASERTTVIRGRAAARPARTSESR